jgi:hypothetical protein
MPSALAAPSRRTFAGCLASALLFFCLGSGPCGYQRAGTGGGSLPKDVKTIAIQPLKNGTLRYRVEQKFTAALAEEILRRRLPVTLVNEPKSADVVLTGEIKNIRTGQALLDNRGLARIFEITIQSGVTLRDQTRNRILFDNQNIEYRGEYEFSQDPRAFFNEEDPAIDRLARDFARSVVTTMLQGF